MHAAKDAVTGVAPAVAATVGVGALPGLAALAPGAAGAAGETVGAAIQSSKYGDKIITGVTHAARFADGYALPVSPLNPSTQGALGAAVSELVKYSQKNSEKNEATNE